MKSPIHATFVVSACPLLPDVTERLGPGITRQLGGGKCVLFYLAALRYAQSLWREGKPAQAILQLNKAFMADLRGDEEALQRQPPPYAVLVWMLRHRPEGRFLGNPVRHFQHLATRVTGERRELRSWRAWACFHLSRCVLPAGDFPVDEKQVAADRLVFPAWETVVDEVRRLGWPGEATVLEETAASLR